MEAVLCGEHARSARRCASELDRRLDRLRAGAREQHALQPRRRAADQLLRKQRRQRRRAELHRSRQVELERFDERCANARVVAPDVEHPEAAEHVEVLVAALVPEVRALRACPLAVEADLLENPRELRVDRAAPQVDVAVVPLREQLGESQIAHVGNATARTARTTTAEPLESGAVASVYDVVTVGRAGNERRRTYVTDDSLAPGDVIRLEGRDWLVERVEPDGDEFVAHVFAKVARYRVRLRHPDGREELGAFRRFRPDAPGSAMHSARSKTRQPASWQVVDVRLAHDDGGEPYRELIAERDFAEVEQLPDHELEHALAAREDELPFGAQAAFARAEARGLSIELVALEPGEAPDWAEAEAFIDALIIEEIEDDLLELCGVAPDRDPREAWIGIVKERLRSDLESFRARRRR